MEHNWQAAVEAGLVMNAALGLGYRLYRLRKGGPKSDVIGQALLAIVLLALALGIAGDHAWGRWAALAYAVLWTFVVMPIWCLAVLIPLPPRRVDYAFTALYWLALGVIGVGAIVL